MPDSILNVLRTVRDFFFRAADYAEKILSDSGKKRLIIIIALSVALAVLLMLIVLLVTAVTPPAVPQSGSFSVPELSQPPVLPAEPDSNSGYIFSRIPAEKWPAEEVEKWFTVPGDRELNDLHTANRRAIDEMMEAVP